MEFSTGDKVIVRKFEGTITSGFGNLATVKDTKGNSHVIATGSIRRPNPENWPPEKNDAWPDQWVTPEGLTWTYQKIETMPGKFTWRMTRYNSTGLIAWSPRLFLAKYPDAKLYMRDVQYA